MVVPGVLVEATAPAAGVLREGVCGGSFFGGGVGGFGTSDLASCFN